jgi:hypothetical protein
LQYPRLGNRLMPELEHDPRLVERLALMHEGNAMAHMKRAAERQEAGDASRSGWTQHQMLAASSFVIAASYWSLIDPRRAVKGYRNTARIYREMRHDYWIVLALASANDNEITPALYAVDETPAPNPQMVAFAMVCNEMYDADHNGSRAERLNSHWREIGNYPIGRLGIPLDYYARCAQAMRAARAKKSVENFFAEVANYVHRAAEVIRNASHDRFHWLRLESTILPAEPEAVAITTAMSVVSHTIFDIPISEVANLDAHGRRLVEIGDEMRGAAYGDN